MRGNHPNRTFSPDSKPLHLREEPSAQQKALSVMQRGAVGGNGVPIALTTNVRASGRTHLEPINMSPNNIGVGGGDGHTEYHYETREVFEYEDQQEDTSQPYTPPSGGTSGGSSSAAVTLTAQHPYAPKPLKAKNGGGGKNKRTADGDYGTGSLLSSQRRNLVEGTNGGGRRTTKGSTIATTTLNKTGTGAGPIQGTGLLSQKHKVSLMENYPVNEQKHVVDTAAYRSIMAGIEEGKELQQQEKLEQQQQQQQMSLIVPPLTRKDGTTTINTARSAITSGDFSLPPLPGGVNQGGGSKSARTGGLVDTVLLPPLPGDREHIVPSSQLRTSSREQTFSMVHTSYNGKVTTRHTTSRTQKRRHGGKKVVVERVVDLNDPAVDALLADRSSALVAIFQEKLRQQHTHFTKRLQEAQEMQTERSRHAPTMWSRGDGSGVGSPLFHKEDSRHFPSSSSAPVAPAPRAISSSSRPGMRGGATTSATGTQGNAAVGEVAEGISPFTPAAATDNTTDYNVPMGAPPAAHNAPIAVKTSSNSASRAAAPVAAGGRPPSAVATMYHDQISQLEEQVSALQASVSFFQKAHEEVSDELRLERSQLPKANVSTMSLDNKQTQLSTPPDKHEENVTVNGGGWKEESSSTQSQNSLPHQSLPPAAADTATTTTPTTIEEIVLGSTQQREETQNKVEDTVGEQSTTTIVSSTSHPIGSGRSSPPVPPVGLSPREPSPMVAALASASCVSRSTGILPAETTTGLALPSILANNGGGQDNYSGGLGTPTFITPPDIMRSAGSSSSASSEDAKVTVLQAKVRELEKRLLETNRSATQQQQQQLHSQPGRAGGTTAVDTTTTPSSATYQPKVSPGAAALVLLNPPPSAPGRGVSSSSSSPRAKNLLVAPRGGGGSSSGEVNAAGDDSLAGSEQHNDDDDDDERLGSSDSSDDIGDDEEEEEEGDDEGAPPTDSDVNGGSGGGSAAPPSSGTTRLLSGSHSSRSPGSRGHLLDKSIRRSRKGTADGGSGGGGSFSRTSLTNSSGSMRTNKLLEGSVNSAALSPMASPSAKATEPIDGRPTMALTSLTTGATGFLLMVGPEAKTAAWTKIAQAAISNAKAHVLLFDGEVAILTFSNPTTGLQFAFDNLSRHVGMAFDIYHPERAVNFGGFGVYEPKYIRGMRTLATYVGKGEIVVPSQVHRRYLQGTTVIDLLCIMRLEVTLHSSMEEDDLYSVHKEGAQITHFNAMALDGGSGGYLAGWSKKVRQVVHGTYHPGGDTSSRRSRKNKPMNTASSMQSLGLSPMATGSGDLLAATTGGGGSRRNPSTGASGGSTKVAAAVVLAQTSRSPRTRALGSPAVASSSLASSVRRTTDGAGVWSGGGSVNGVRVPTVPLPAAQKKKKSEQEGGDGGGEEGEVEMEEEEGAKPEPGDSPSTVASKIKLVPFEWSNSLFSTVPSAHLVSYVWTHPSSSHFKGGGGVPGGGGSPRDRSASEIALAGSGGRLVTNYTPISATQRVLILPSAVDQSKEVGQQSPKRGGGGVGEGSGGGSKREKGGDREVLTSAGTCSTSTSTTATSASTPAGDEDPLTSSSLSPRNRGDSSTSSLLPMGPRRFAVHQGMQAFPFTMSASVGPAEDIRMTNKPTQTPVKAFRNKGTDTHDKDVDDDVYLSDLDYLNRGLVDSNSNKVVDGSGGSPTANGESPRKAATPADLPRALVARQNIICNMTCRVCNEVLNDAHVLHPCGHVYCGRCVESNAIRAERRPEGGQLEVEYRCPRKACRQLSLDLPMPVPTIDVAVEALRTKGFFIRM